MVEHTQTIYRQKSKNCLSVFDRFVGLVVKGLKYVWQFFNILHEKVKKHTENINCSSQIVMQHRNLGPNIFQRIFSLRKRSQKCSL